MKGVLTWLVRWDCRAGKRGFCPSLAALVGPVQTTCICFLTVHYFNSFVPIAQQAGGAVVLGRLSLSMWLWEKSTLNLVSLFSLRFAKMQLLATAYTRQPTQRQ
jgi:hypothetical protein